MLRTFFFKCAQDDSQEIFNKYTIIQKNTDSINNAVIKELHRKHARNFFIYIKESNTDISNYKIIA